MSSPSVNVSPARTCRNPRSSWSSAGRGRRTHAADAQAEIPPDIAGAGVQDEHWPGAHFVADAAHVARKRAADAAAVDVERAARVLQLALSASRASLVIGRTSKLDDADALNLCCQTELSVGS